MVNRRTIMRDAAGTEPAHDPEVHSLFSSISIRKCTEQPKDSVSAQIGTITEVIDQVLLSMATEGYVCSAAESDIAEMLQDIGSKGRLTAAPWDNQPRLKLNCRIPQAHGRTAVPKVSRGKKTPAAPSKEWAKLGGCGYDFVDGRK